MKESSNSNSSLTGGYQISPSKLTLTEKEMAELPALPSADDDTNKNDNDNGKKKDDLTILRMPSRDPPDAASASTPSPSLAAAAMLETERATFQSQQDHTMKRLEHARITISKLEGLIGSLKSIILHMDPVRGRAVLTGEIAAMEDVLFGINTAEEKKEDDNNGQSEEEEKPKKKKKKKKDKKSKKIGKDKGGENHNDNPTRKHKQKQEREQQQQQQQAKQENMRAAGGDEEEPAMQALEDSMDVDGKDLLDINLDAGDDPLAPPTAATTSTTTTTKASLLNKNNKASAKEQVPAKSHPRVTGASYWKEFSAQTPSQMEQAASLERIMKKKNAGWSLTSMFSSS